MSPGKRRIPVLEEVALGLHRVEVEGGSSFCIDPDGEIEDTEAGGVAVLPAVLQLEADAWILAVEAGLQLPGFVRVLHECRTIIDVALVQRSAGEQRRRSSLLHS